MTAPTSSAPPQRHRIVSIMNLIVLLLSLGLIIWISYDTFELIDFLQSSSYMTFQLWVCFFFILDFFVELRYAPDKWGFVRRRIVFLILSVPYLNIINMCNLQLSHDALYFIRFIPLARGALAMSIVMGYLSSNAITSLFMSYLVIMVFVGYFCSLIFYQREFGVNPQVTSYWSSLWWSAMNMTTVGCNIEPVTVAGKITAVILPVVGMVIFPLFTVYLTNYVTTTVNRARKADADRK